MHDLDARAVTPTMKAVIWLTSRPFFMIEGVRAITTRTSATTPLVHQSFSPLRIHFSAIIMLVDPTSTREGEGADLTPGEARERRPSVRRFRRASAAGGLRWTGAPRGWR